MDIKDRRKGVYSTTARMIHIIENTANESARKARLAQLRNSIGKPLSAMSDVWQFLFENIPDEFLGTNAVVTIEENAIISALQIYALCMQGSSICKASDEKNSIGYSLSLLRNEDDTVAIDNRFNLMVSAGSFEELFNHLRGLVRILKTKTGGSINYARLASDFFFLQTNVEKDIKLEWARSYYRIKVKVSKEDKNEQ